MMEKVDETGVAYITMEDLPAVVTAIRYALAREQSNHGLACKYLAIQARSDKRGAEYGSLDRQTTLDAKSDLHRRLERLDNVLWQVLHPEHKYDREKHK